jgi:hypothetical protein
MAYLKADRNSSTVAAGGHGDHVPVSVELGRNCSGSETENYESGGESEDACTIANHGDPRSKVRTISEAPATGDTGASGFHWGEPVMGRETHHCFCSTPAVLQLCNKIFLSLITASVLSG